MGRRTFWASGVIGATWALAGCTPPPEPVDLLEASAILTEGTAAGRDRDWVLGQTGKPIRIHDVVRRTIPASPPGKLTYTVDVPKNARLSFACGIPETRHNRPGVEFVVKARKKGGPDAVLWQELLDPVQRPKQRRWVSADVDLAAYAGDGVTFTFETRGFEPADDDPRTAFWAAPAIHAARDDRPLVVVYLVDTLRADHTTPYGYARDTTPELARFAKDAVVFEAAVAHASWTKPSVASIFTSLLPGRHRAVQLRDPLDAGHVTLAELLKAKSFSTGAAIANSVVYSTGVNFDQGFDYFAGLHGPADRPSKDVEAGPVIDAALAWLDARRGLPGFLYIHTMDPHVPYTPPAPFDRKYEPHPTDGHPGIDPRTDYKEAADRERMVAQYDGEIAYGDQEFGRFIEGLKSRGLYDRALIVFMADHGEEFLDHDGWLHGRTVFDELIRIPFIVKFPGKRDAGKRVAQQVRTVDVLPTVLQELGLPVPAPPDIAGFPLQEVVKGGAPEPPAVAEISHRGFVAHGMRTGKDKYIRRFSPADDELYFDLEKDPKEKENRIAEAVDRSRKLKGEVEAAMVPNPYRHNLRFTGAGRYELKLKTGGWIEGIEADGLGVAERHELEQGGRKLALLVTPKAGSPREIAFSVRPMGAPIWLEGTRDGRPLKPADVFMAQEGIHPDEVPFPLPEVESERERAENMLAPPKDAGDGIHLWLTLRPGANLLGPFDKDTCERMKALGYVGSCPG